MIFDADGHFLEEQVLPNNVKSALAASGKIIFQLAADANGLFGIVTQIKPDARIAADPHATALPFELPFQPVIFPIIVH